MDYPFVSAIMPCRNELGYISRSLGSLVKTIYPKDRLEIIVVDGESDDGTLHILKELASQNPVVKILPNPKRITPSAMNIGIRQAKGEIVIRVDAHSEYPPDYINKCVEYLSKTDTWCVGGAFYTIPSGDTLMAKIIASVLSSPFGVASYFRTKKKPGYVDTVPFGAFKKEIFEKIGLFDERLIRNQDNEFSSRIIKSGGKIFITLEIKNFYYAPANLEKLLNHARLTGMWNAFTHHLLPYTLKWRHLAPLFFFIGLFFCLAFIILGILEYKAILILGIAPLFLYFALASAFSILICLNNRFNLLTTPLIVSVFFLYHFNYGWGIFKGWILIFTGKWKKIVPEEKRK